MSKSFVYQNPFVFDGIVRTGDKGEIVKIRFLTDDVPVVVTIGHVRSRLRELREAKVDDIYLAPELQAIEAYEKELKKDRWDEFVFDESLEERKAKENAK